MFNILVYNAIISGLRVKYPNNLDSSNFHPLSHNSIADGGKIFPLFKLSASATPTKAYQCSPVSLRPLIQGTLSLSSSAELAKAQIADEDILLTGACVSEFICRLSRMLLKLSVFNGVNNMINGC